MKPYLPYRPYRPYLAGAGSIVPLFSWNAFDLALGATATFTRASTAYVKDHLGVYNAVKSGESRFEGARRVQNLATGLTTQTLTVVSGDTYQVTIKGTTGATCECSNAFTGTLTASGTSRISWASGTPKTSGSTSLVLTVTGTLTELQVENVTSRTLKVPSEYASVGVLSAPYHGTNVDGVKYFAYANGNTVDANGVVTEAQGAAIDPGTIKLLMEPVATNLVKQSQVFATLSPPWYQVRLTATENQATAPNGSLTACLLTFAAGGYNYVTQSGLTLANATVSIYAKAGTASLLSIDLGGSGAADITLFNLALGTVVSTGANNSTSTITAVGNGWYRLKTTRRSTAAGEVYIGHETPTAGQTCYIWGCQIEAGSVSTSYIPTTTAAVTRAVDALAYSGIAADNETRQVINVANVDIDDWNGTKATPTVPELISSINVYRPGERPA